MKNQESMFTEKAALQLSSKLNLGLERIQKNFEQQNLKDDFLKG